MCLQNAANWVIRNKKNPSTALCLPPTLPGKRLTKQDIAKHYRRLAKLVHPDKSKAAGADEAFKVLHESYQLLTRTAR